MMPRSPANATYSPIGGFNNYICLLPETVHDAALPVPAEEVEVRDICQHAHSLVVLHHLHIITRIRVSDPDWIRIQSGQWIQIRIRNPDLDPRGQKCTTKSRKKFRNFML
jgi:hypothetical protein